MMRSVKKTSQFRLLNGQLEGKKAKSFSSISAKIRLTLKNWKKLLLHILNNQK